jgi:hypothetical protein
MTLMCSLLRCTLGETRLYRKVTMAAAQFAGVRTTSQHCLRNSPHKSNVSHVRRHVRSIAKVRYGFRHGQANAVMIYVQDVKISGDDDLKDIPRSNNQDRICVRLPHR